MKTSQSSRAATFLACLIFLIFLSVTTTSASTRVSQSRLDSIQEHQGYNYQMVQGKNELRKSWNTISRSGTMQSPPAMIKCHQLQKIRHCPPFPTPPPPPSDYEIDPRYGVEKRLVPSGPNPLHN